MNTTGFFKDGRTYEERTRSTLMDGEGYITDLFRAQERTSDHVRVTNEMFNKFYKAPKISKKTKYNKLLNDTIKNSSPSFYVEQAFNTDGVEMDNGRYNFKLDPSFMSCNSVYKTIALRGIFMKPKRYTLKYALDMFVMPPERTEKITITNEPIFEYDVIEMSKQTYYSKNRVSGVEATIIDENGDQYDVTYKQDYKYRGDTFQSNTPLGIDVYYKGQKYSSEHNSVTFEDNDKEISFTFHPEGIVEIVRIYKVGDDTYIETMEFEKDEPWDEGTSDCTVTINTKVINSEPIGVKIPFNITLLPENSIEVFAHEVTTLINSKLMANDNEHINKCEVSYDYESNINRLTFIYRSNEDNTIVEARFTPIDNKHRSECITFNNILNQINYPINPVYGTETVFNNVWNREYFFVHASYMNLVQYNQLGRSGEIYPKPTKLTRYSSSIPDIEFWTSLNGIDPFVLHDQDFEVDLALAATLNNADITF